MGPWEQVDVCPGPPVTLYIQRKNRVSDRNREKGHTLHTAKKRLFVLNLGLRIQRKNRDSVWSWGLSCGGREGKLMFRS
jgi:hypothetical protein